MGELIESVEKGGQKEWVKMVIMAAAREIQGAVRSTRYFILSYHFEDGVLHAPAPYVPSLSGFCGTTDITDSCIEVHFSAKGLLKKHV